MSCQMGGMNYEAYMPIDPALLQLAPETGPVGAEQAHRYKERLSRCILDAGDRLPILLPTIAE